MGAGFKKRQETKVVQVAFQVGFFLEPVYHYIYVVVPVVKKRNSQRSIYPTKN